jgi:hypothetical protein
LKAELQAAMLLDFLENFSPPLKIFGSHSPDNTRRFGHGYSKAFNGSFSGPEF